MSRPVYLKNKKVLVMGLGKFGGGVGVTKWLVGQGAKVTVVDLKTQEKLVNSIKQLEELGKLEFKLGSDSHNQKLLDEHEIMVVNPAVKPTNEYLQAAKTKGLKLTTEMNLFFERCRGKIIGVTGTNGKETVVRMIELMVREAGIKPYIGGNIGRSLLESLDKIHDRSWVLLELSSFQLERLAWIQKSPHVAVIINITPNHLDWHGTYQDYIQAKANILRWQKNTDKVILNTASPAVKKLVELVQGKLVRIDQMDDFLLPYLKVPGKHNLWNATVAAAVAKELDVTDRQISAGLKKFHGLEHALEFVCDRNGVIVYNDSEATNPVATMVALEAFNQPIILIAGGSDKGVDLRSLVESMIGKVKILISIGQTGPRIQSLLKEIDRARSIESRQVTTLTHAVKVALQTARPGDILLLSPACASYDMFENLQERGKLFKQLTCPR